MINCPAEIKEIKEISAISAISAGHKKTTDMINCPAEIKEIKEISAISAISAGHKKTTDMINCPAEIKEIKERLTSKDDFCHFRHFCGTKQKNYAKNQHDHRALQCDAERQEIHCGAAYPLPSGPLRIHRLPLLHYPRRTAVPDTPREPCGCSCQGIQQTFAGRMLRGRAEPTGQA